MRLSKLFPVVFALTCFGAGAEPVEVLELADATPGRTGVCVTEMDGGERVEIPLTVLGTIGLGGPESEIVLVRLQGQRIEKTGIISGMSGSPVYLDGKLLGALAYGWPFSKEPIGGVTPFESMLKVEPTLLTGEGVIARPPLPDMLDAMHQGTLGKMLVDWLLPEGSQPMTPLPVTVSVGGWLVPSGDGWLAESWRRMGWVGTPGGGASPVGSESPRPIVPGAMVAGVMVDGDATMAAAGTVTEVRGDKVWAFGHPMLGAGTVELPLARAHVVAVLPSVMSSFKFFTVGEPVGALVADRTHGILGKLGRTARMVPVKVTVNGSEYDFRTVRHPVLLPALTAYLTQATQRVRGRAFGNQTLNTRLEIRYTGMEPAVIGASFAGVQAPAEAAAFSGAVLGYLEASRFSAPEVESVDIQLNMVEELQTATIVEIHPERRIVHPGDSLDVHFRLRPYRGSEELRTLTLEVPAGVPDGRIDLVAADGASWSSYDLQMRPLNPGSFADEVRLVNSLQPATVLVAVLEHRDVGVTVEGGTVSAPAGMVVQLHSVLGANLKTTAYSVFARTEAQLPFPVSGAQRISLTVRSRD
jgi:hypothetical protein